MQCVATAIDDASWPRAIVVVARRYIHVVAPVSRDACKVLTCGSFGTLCDVQPVDNGALGWLSVQPLERHRREVVGPQAVCLVSLRAPSARSGNSRSDSQHGRLDPVVDLQLAEDA